jgi:hypothetical protein
MCAITPEEDRLGATTIEPAALARSSKNERHAFSFA